jgi:hypothetical protein
LFSRFRHWRDKFKFKLHSHLYRHLASYLPAPLPSSWFCYPGFSVIQPTVLWELWILQPVTQDCRPPHLLRFTFLTFHLQPRNVSVCTVIFRLHPNVGGSPVHPAESSSLSCGPTVRFRLLPTPPHGDAVTFSYGAVAYSDIDLHHADKSPSWAHDETASR